MERVTGAGGQYPGDDSVTDDFELAGVPDAFQRLWTPHRMAYIKGGQSQFKDRDACPFCIAPSRSDEESLIVHRGTHAYVILNLFPYNPGHLLVCPYRHVPDYTDVDTNETIEIAELTQTAMRVLREVAKPTGFNLGMNQGVTGGAGIAAHLHQHVVPRWGGDGNFLPIIAQTKAITQTLDEVRTQMAAAWPGRPGSHTTAAHTSEAGGAGAE
ncbi:HIT domain-containing protein [Arthrobacter sp. H20]|uniref:HIT family protein n=1 Tax=Arthrobacter sp. H20 TaxID=1267981 RepID=UPI0020A63475|nr:HIT domain-containing protein [Arthrobacter sp. H20]